MTDDTRKMMEEVAAEWMKARRVISGFLEELCPHLNTEQNAHNAAAIIARLSHAGFSLQFDPDIKDATQ